MKKFYYVYFITLDTPHGEMYYIGKRSCNCEIEKDNYWGSGLLLKKAINKYGKERMTKKIICEYTTEEEAYEKEKYFISIFNACCDSCFYNLTEGGEGSLGYKFTEEQIKRNTEGLKKYHSTHPINEAQRKGLKKGHGHNRGQKASEETRHKLSEAHRGVPLSEKHIQSKKDAMTPEVRKKISDSLKGKKQSEETKKKRSESRKSYYRKIKEQAEN